MLFLLFGTTASANVVLGTNHPASDPLLMNPGITSDTFLVDVTNTVSPDFLAGWQVELVIIPLGATGSLTFNTGLTGKPDDNYLFNGLSTIGGPSFPEADRLVDFEATFPFATVSVPAAPGANLLKTAFDASTDAFGTFGIFAVSGLGHSEWTDDKINARDYANLPSPGGNVEIGRVIIPEPSPETTFIKAGSTAWHPLYRQFVDPSDSLGKDVEVAENSPLAQVNVNEIHVQFSEDVIVTSGDLLLTGDTVADYSGMISGFNYDSGTFLATWTLSEPLEADRLNLQLAAVTDLAGNPLVATSVDFTALPADSNQDEVVLSDDLVQVRNLQFELITGLGTATSNYSPRHDLNGDGVILSDDLVLSRNHQFSLLPLPPTASIPEPSTCFLLMLGALPLRLILRRRNA